MLKPKTDQKYKSPLRKLVKFFETSRDQWKDKYLTKKKQVKQLQNRVKYLEQTKPEWKQKVQHLKTQVKQKELEAKALQKELLEKKTRDTQKEINNRNDFETIPFHHRYSVGHMMLCFSFVLKAASSLRGGTQCLEVVKTFLGLSLNVPSWHEGRLWLLRLGYYKLNCPKVQGTDWVWIVDHTIQLGCEKSLVILGIRLSDLPSPGKSLKHEDVEAITLSPVTQSNGEIVYEQLKESIVKTGVPRMIVADQGSDLKTGIERFCNHHPNTIYIYDIKHKIANILKRELQNEEVWSEFKSLASQTKKQLQQTSLAHHCSPSLRTKARYMNVDKLVKWGGEQLQFLAQTQNQPEKLTEKLAWLWDYRENIEQWNELISEVTYVENFVKKQGLTQQSHAELSKQLEEQLPSRKTLRNQNVRQELIEFVKVQGAKAHSSERLLGSSFVLESVFGKQKWLEQEQAKSGFTGLILGIAAIVSTTTSEVVKKAMETVPTQAVLDWCQENIGSSVQAQKIKMQATLKTE
jgi:hypothetical protein